MRFQVSLVALPIETWFSSLLFAMAWAGCFSKIVFAETRVDPSNLVYARMARIYGPTEPLWFIQPPRKNR